MTTTDCEMEVSTFRMLRPGLTDPARYPNALIEHYLRLGFAQLDRCRWADLYDEGLLDWTAHYVVIQVRNAQAAERGAVSGNAIGRVSSKSVGGVSVNYDLGNTEETDGGHWNMTTYGSAFLRNARMVGMGGQQLGGNPNAIIQNMGGAAWPGPPQINFLPSPNSGG